MGLLQGRPAMMPDFQKDYEAGRRLLSDNGLPVFEAPIHLEGGSIHSDGQGTMVVTEECLLDPSRNPELGREGIEQVRCRFLPLAVPCSARVLRICRPPSAYPRFLICPYTAFLAGREW